MLAYNEFFERYSLVRGLMTIYSINFDTLGLFYKGVFKRFVEVFDHVVRRTFSKGQGDNLEVQEFINF